MGAARNRLLLYEQDGQAYLRAAGTWDPMPWYVDQGYRRAGYDAQHAFWGQGAPEQSMLHQIALAVARGGGDDGATDAADVMGTVEEALHGHAREQL